MVKFNPVSINYNRLVVDITKQTITFISADGFDREWPVSTAAAGTGNEIGSSCTPLGMHMIVQLFGNDQPSGTIFKSRRSTGVTAEFFYDQIKRSADHVTSRVIRLKGVESAVNGNSFRRYIYIHGTPEEGLIGNPVSHGCIRMKNADVIELFKIVQLGMPVLIK